MNTTQKKLLSNATINKRDGLEKRIERIRQLSTTNLFGEANEIMIAHMGESYSLTITKQKKLLLTKAK